MRTGLKRVVFLMGGGLIGWGLGNALAPELGWVLALMGAAVGLWMHRRGSAGTLRSTDIWYDDNNDGTDDTNDDDDDRGGWFGGGSDDGDDGGDSGGDD